VCVCVCVCVCVQVTTQFVEDLVAHQKSEKRLHKKFALQILYKVTCAYMYTRIAFTHTCKSYCV